MSNWTKVCIEIDDAYIEDFEAMLKEKGYEDIVRYTQDFPETKVYEIECNHYDRLDIQDWLEAVADEHDDWTFYKEVGMDEYSHWENGTMDDAHVYLDVAIWKDKRYEEHKEE